MEKWGFLVCLLLILSGCANKEYDEALAKGYQALEEKDYEQAEASFETALAEEKDSEEAKQGQEAAKLLNEATKAYEEGEWKDVLSAVVKFSKEANFGQAGEIVQADVEDLHAATEEMQEQVQTLEAQLTTAMDYRNQQSFDEALAIYQELSENQEKHKAIQSLVQKASEELTVVQEEKKSYEEEQKRIAEEKRLAEEKRRIEEKRLAEEKRVAEEKKRQEEEQKKKASQGVSPEQAEQIIRKAIQVPASTSVVYDHDDGPDYIIHVYDVVEDDISSHTATRGWYAVNKKTGEWYDWFAAQMQ